MKSISWNARSQATLAAVTWALVACGGGSGSSESSSVLQGTAAVGSPVADANLSLRCAAGERSAVTDPTGRYRIDLSGLSLPCTMVLSGGKVDGSANSVTMSTVIVPGAQVANITPWTHLVVARLLASDPDTAVAGLAPADLPGKLSAAKLSAATEAVRIEVGHLMGAAPSAEIDPITTAFTATANDGMDDLLVQIATALSWTSRTLPQAAQEIATGPLQIKEVPLSCKPGVLTGFTGKFDDVPVQVPASPSDSGGGSGGGDGGGAGGGAGAGAGGSLGQFLNTLVRVERNDGSLLGEATTDSDKGMVTVVPCRYQGPLHITVKAKADGSSKYYEESTGQYAVFPAGEEMNAVVPTVNKNLGITLLTEASWQYLLAKYGVDGWRDKGHVVEANLAIGTEFNKFLPKDLQVADITRLPFLVSGKTTASSIDTNRNGVYGLVSSGLARAAGLLRSGDLEPALKLVRQLGRDLCDGVLDLRCNGTLVVADAKDAAYLPPQFAETLNRGVGDVVAACGTTSAGQAAFRVTQIAIDSAPTSQAYGDYFVDTYHDQQPIYLLRSDGRAFYWPTRDAAATPFLPQYSFNRIFPQVGYPFAGLSSDGKFVSQTNFNDLGSVVEQPTFAGATTTAGYINGPWHRSRIARLPSGHAAYYPHYEQGDVSQQASTKVTLLSNITAVSWARGDDNHGNPGTGAGENLKDKPTFYAVTADGAAYAWGNDREGALGDGKVVNEGDPAPGTGVPSRVKGLPAVTSVIGVNGGAFALDAQGGVWAWGRIASVQALLAGLTDERAGISTALKLKNFDAFGPIQQISCGVTRICAALTRSGKLLAWGMFGEQSYTLMPAGFNVPYQQFGVTEVGIPKDRRVTYLGASQDMIYAVLDDGTLVLFPTYPTAPKFVDTRQVLPASTGSVSATCQARH